MKFQISIAWSKYPVIVTCHKIAIAMLHDGMRVVLDNEVKYWQVISIKVL
jgi:hypothetical protein